LASAPAEASSGGAAGGCSSTFDSEVAEAVSTRFAGLLSAIGMGVVGGRLAFVGAAAEGTEIVGGSSISGAGLVTCATSVAPCGRRVRAR
jgi:hypothetical protein